MSLSQNPVRLPGPALVARSGDLFLELATSAGAVLARFPGGFTQAECSADGRHVVAGDSRGQVYFFRLRGPANLLGGDEEAAGLLYFSH